MADISNEVGQIERAIYGEEVRGSIVSALTKLNEQQPDKHWQDEIDKKQDKLVGSVGSYVGFDENGAAQAQMINTDHIRGLQTALDNKQNSLKTLGGTTGKYVGFTSSGDVSAQNILISEVSNLQTNLDGKQPLLSNGIRVTKGDFISGIDYGRATTSNMLINLKGTYKENEPFLTGDTWYDGKEIHRLVIPLKAQGNTGNAAETSYPLPETVETLINMRGSVWRNSTLIVPIPGFATALSYIVAGEIRNTGTSFVLYTGASIGILRGVIILDYTAAS